MKKILFALCVLLLVPTLALANSDMVSVSELRQQVETMGRWTASYEAYKRKIEVDIPIDIPEVDAVPIVQVSGYYAVDQEGCLTRDGTKLNRIGYDGFDIYEEDGLLMYLGTTCANGEIKAALFEQDKSVLLLAYYNSPSNLRTHKVKYDSKVYYPYEVDADEIYAEDNPQSAAAAKAYLERVLGYFYPESDNSIALRYLEVRSRGHKVKGLGSGYVGTADGLTFKPGIRYSETYIFYDFRREGERFVCELVKVVDPYSKKIHWVSKHLAPYGEESGVIAEIRDEI